MKQISDIVKSAVDAIWLSYDPETMQRGFEVLEQAAADGDADALCFMGRCFLGEQYVWSGGGFPENETRGENLIAESVEKGSTAGVLCAMRAGIEIENPPVSLQEAFESIKAQADEGDVFCAYMTANAYFWGDILEIYPEVAEKLSAKYSREEFEEGYNAMAYPLAVPYYEKSFEGGLSSGFGNYRSIYRSGLTDVNEQRVEKYLKRLALAGSPVCCNEYGKYLEDKFDNAEEAFRFYKMAYDKGDYLSAYNLATCYGRGYGVDENLDEAFRLYKEAAEAGNANARFQLGNFYFEGRGNVEKDYVLAMRWLRKAYEPSADWRAAAEMGVMYQNGWGVEQDSNTAFRYLRRLEDEDLLDELWEPLDTLVFTALGVAYAYGRGTGQNIERGVIYLDKAIEYGSEEAREHRRHFKKGFFGWKQK